MTRCMQARIALTLTLLTVTMSARAEPKIVVDTGATVPIEKYNHALDVKTEPTRPPTFEDMVARMLPARPVELTPGPQAGRAEKNVNVFIPFFLLGTDNLSLNWLEKNKNKLVELKAVGYLIEAPNMEAWANVIKRTNNRIRIQVASDKGFAERLQIQHYPVLVNSEGIWQ